MAMANPSSSSAQPTLRRRTAAWVTALGLVLLGAATAIALSWREQLPDPVASHWGADGTADGFTSLTAVLAFMLGFGVPLVLGFGAVTLFLGQSAVIRRIGAGATIWSALFISLVTLGSLYVQRGLTDARTVPGIGGVLLLAIAGSLVPALIVGAAVPADPRMPTTETVASDAPRAKLTAGERTTWEATAEARSAVAIGLVSVALVLAAVLVTRMWVLLVIVCVIGLILASMLRWTVHVDSSGLMVRSALGWPRIRVPLDEVIRADVAEIRPVRDFGGWGIRVGKGGRVGVVLRRGEALVVQRTGGRSVAVTVDGARTAAGVLNALADRARRT
jgi:hypothetical protein